MGLSRDVLDEAILERLALPFAPHLNAFTFLVVRVCMHVCERETVGGGEVNIRIYWCMMGFILLCVYVVVIHM